MTNSWTEARARLYKQDGRWHMEVTSYGKIVGRDVCTKYETLANLARREVEAVRYVTGIGHRLRPYDEL